MAGLRGLFVQRDASNNGTTPKGARLALGGLLAPSTTDPLSVRTGVLVDGMQAVVTGTGSMAYQVRGFVGVTKFTDANGPVLAANDAPVSVSTTPSPGSNSRIDRVWMIQRLITGDGGSGAVNVFEFGVTQGNVAASPTPPTGIPAGAEPLYDFTVTAGATSTSGLTATRRHEWTVSNGGVLPSGTRGQFWDGSGWKSLVTVESGTITSTPFWTPTGSDQTWTRHDRIVTLSGAFTGGSVLPATATGTAGVQLNGPPLPSRDRGLVIRSGNRLLSGWINPSGLLQWASTIGAGNSTNITLDGLTYEVPT